MMHSTMYATTSHVSDPFGETVYNLTQTMAYQRGLIRKATRNSKLSYYHDRKKLKPSEKMLSL